LFRRRGEPIGGDGVDASEADLGAQDLIFLVIYDPPNTDGTP